MCRPSCCKQTNEGAGIAAVAVIAGAAFVAVKIGPVVARILHLVVEVLAIILLTAVSALAAIVLIWVTARVVRARAGKRCSAGQISTVRVAGTGHDKSRLLVAKAQEAIDDDAIVYVIDPKVHHPVPRPGHPAKAGAGYDCACGECLIPRPSDDQAAG
jgi:hypothetical protein